jgi:D-tyrosyl-tRNA(Tyr) deacylase
VRVDGETVGEMEEGLLVLIGVAREDGPADARLLADKLVHLRVFLDAQGKMNLSLLETGGSLGIVSQFTLLGDARKGRRPSYVEAAPPEQAEPLIELLVAEARAHQVPVITGRFRARMQVDLCNDGPVTLLLDTRRLF